MTQIRRAMIYKAAGLPFGGRKAVLIGDPRAVETQRLLEQAEKRDERSHGTPAGPRETGRVVAF